MLRPVRPDRPDRPVRPVRSALALAGLTGLLAACLLAARGAPASAASRACPKPPLTVTILPGPIGTTTTTGTTGTTGTAGSASVVPSELAVTDAVARRVPIVPDTDATTSDPDALAKLRKKAAKTRLALFTMYLADFKVPRKQLSGYGFGDVSAPDGKTVAAVTIVPTEKRGFATGDVAEVAPFEYDATTTFAPLGLVVNSSGKRSTYAYDGVEGSVTIRKLTRKSICLDIDVAFTRRGETVASAVGTVQAPVVKAPPEFFYT